MSDYFEKRISSLEAEITRLKRREGHVIKLLDPNEKDWARFCLENDLDKEQEGGICDTMNYALSTLESRPIEVSDFESRLRPYVPEAQQPSGQLYPFIQCLLINFAKNGPWYAVVAHFRDAYNVPHAERLKG